MTKFWTNVSCNCELILLSGFVVLSGNVWYNVFLDPSLPWLGWGLPWFRIMFLKLLKYLPKIFEVGLNLLLSLVGKVNCQAMLTPWHSSCDEKSKLLWSTTYISSLEVSQRRKLTQSNFSRSSSSHQPRSPIQNYIGQARLVDCPNPLTLIFIFRYLYMS